MLMTDGEANVLNLGQTHSDWEDTIQSSSFDLDWLKSNDPPLSMFGFFSETDPETNNFGIGYIFRSDDAVLDDIVAAKTLLD